MFLSRWKLSKLIDHNENSVNDLQYNIHSSGKLGFSGYCFFFADILKFPGDRLELLPSV